MTASESPEALMWRQRRHRLCVEVQSHNGRARRPTLGSSPPRRAGAPPGQARRPRPRPGAPGPSRRADQGPGRRAGRRLIPHPSSTRPVVNRKRWGSTGSRTVGHAASWSVVARSRSDLGYLAKVGVAGSNPVVRSERERIRGRSRGLTRATSGSRLRIARRLRARDVPAGARPRKPWCRGARGSANSPRFPDSGEAFEAAAR